MIVVRLVSTCVKAQFLTHREGGQQKVIVAGWCGGETEMREEQGAGGAGGQGDTRKACPLLRGHREQGVSGWGQGAG